MKFLALLALSCLSASASAAVVFSPPVQLTPDSGKQFQLTRTPTRTAAFDSNGTLHLVYWAGGAATTPSTPSEVYYQTRTAQGVWSQAVELDANSTIDRGFGLEKMGGRHPQLALAANNDLYVVWHDYRHCNPASPANSIDNVEVYAQYRPAGLGVPQDIRLTNTTAAHLGDNSYLPRLALLPNGTFSVLWYDFNANMDVSDLYALHTANLAAYVPQSLASSRLTVETARAGTSLEKPYSAPDFLADSTNTLHAVWTSQFDSEAPAWYSTIPNPSGTITEQQIFPTTGGFFDPPRLVLAPNDDVWVVVRTGSLNGISVRRKPAGQATFQPELMIQQPSLTPVSQPSLAVDSTGVLHLTWISGGNTVIYRRVTVPGIVLEEQIVASGANFQRTNLLLKSNGEPVIFYDTLSGATNGEVFFVGVQSTAKATGWDRYE